MKLLLALSLLLFLNSVFSQGRFTPCLSYGKCPKGYLPQFSGRNMLNAECYCKKLPPILSRCGSLAETCILGDDQICYAMESNCSAKEIIDTCNEYNFDLPEICDRAYQKLRKEDYEKVQRTCAFYRDKCYRMFGDHCLDAARYCDPDTTVQLCKNKRITEEYICEAAEINQEKYQAEGTKYSCQHAQTSCLTNEILDACPIIPKFCDAETTANWCYKNDTNQVEKLSDEDCSRVVKKSQDLMFGKSKQECWKQIPLCEGGNSEACTQVATFCVKEVTSALCNAKKITNKRICKYAGSDKTASPSYPGCKFFVDKCKKWENEYCQLASRYCDNKTIGDICKSYLIRDQSVCKRVQDGNSGSIDIHIPIIGGTVKLPGGLGLGLGL